MYSVNAKSVGKLILFELRNSRKKLIGWCVAIFAITFLYMILFPSVKDMAEIKMEAMPKELMQFVGMDDFSDVSNFITYFGMIYNIILVAISIFAVTFSANLILKEEKEKTIEFLYSLEVSRGELYAAKFITSFVGVFAVVLSSVVSAAICGSINGGETFEITQFIKISRVSGSIPFVFMFFSVMLAGISSKIGATFGSMVVVLCYVLGYLSELLGDNGQWLAYLSPFTLFSSPNVLDINTNVDIALVVYIVLAIVFIGFGCVQYKKRDFNI